MRKIILGLLLVSCSLFGDYGVLKGESSSGMSKICYYSTPSGTKAITINSYEVCPVSFDF